MFLKNYTSDVPVPHTIMRMETTLIKCGVKGIEKQYEADGRVTAMTFTIEFPEAPSMKVKIPVREDQVLKVLWDEYVNGDKVSEDGESIGWPRTKRKTKESFREQARRTSWKLMQDWVEVQMSLILMKQADVREVFLPYVMMGKRTVFEHIQEKGFRALLPEKVS